jgi:nucleotide-binding universal stress UspA family protein
MKRILVGIDGSLRAPLVLDAAVATARAHGARLILLRAIAIPTEVPEDFWKETDTPLLELLRRHCAAYLDGVAAEIPKEILEKVEVRIGVPWEAICSAAREERVDLIVIGSHGYSGLDRVLGTTAGKVVNHALCSVLVVRPPSDT